MKNKKKYKSGFTVIELLITISVISIFFVMVTMISYSISKAFNNKNEYQEAINLKENIISEISSNLKGVNSIQLRAPKYLISEEGIVNADFYPEQKILENVMLSLNSHNCMFSKYGKMYKIGMNLEEYPNSKVANISDIKEKNPNIKYDKHKDIFYYLTNPLLKGFFKNQEQVYFNDLYKEENNPYSKFLVEITFSPYRNNKDSKKEVIGIIANISIYRDKNDKKPYKFEEPIELLNLKTIEDGKNCVLDNIKDDQKEEYSILYYTTIEIGGK